jgi:2-dehydro-3-deoxygluconokinase
MAGTGRRRTEANDGARRSVDGPRASTDGSSPPPVAVGTLGEGLLEVGVFPALPEDVLGRGYGGDAANVAVMSARLGARARLITRLGDDAAGRLLLRFWREAGVETDYVAVDPSASTGLYVNDRQADGGHTFSYYRAGSAASRLSPAGLASVPVEDLDVLHLTGITLAISASAAAAAEAALERARAAGVRVSFAVNFRAQLDPDRERLAALARGADVLFISDDDSEALFGVRAPEDVLDALGPRAGETILTRGADPAWAVTDDGVVTVAPPHVEIVDTAGAGDALAGTYLASRFAGASTRGALARGVAAAALSCGRSGCAAAYPSPGEVAAAAELLGDPRDGVLR